MPYIDEDRREELLMGETVETPGELNFMISLLCSEFLESQGGPSYLVFNDIVGALEAAKLEFYRRVVAPYENEKLEMNGDVY